MGCHGSPTVTPSPYPYPRRLYLHRPDSQFLDPHRPDPYRRHPCRPYLHHLYCLRLDPYRPDMYYLYPHHADPRRPDLHRPGLHRPYPHRDVTIFAARGWGCSARSSLRVRRENVPSVADRLFGCDDFPKNLPTVGWLMCVDVSGDEPHGMNHMFTFINTSRLGTAIMGVALAELSWQ
eukprot:196170-Rhodomonas_salina.1